MMILGMFGPIEVLIILMVVALGLLLPLIALVDILRSNFQANNKLIWVVVVVFTNILGSILYFLIGRNQRIKN